MRESGGLGAGFFEDARGDFHGRYARLRVLRDEPVFDGGLRRRLHYSFFGFQPKKDSADGSAPQTPRRRELRAGPLNCAHSCHQFNGTSINSADKMGGLGGEASVAVWAKPSRRSASEAHHRKQNSSRSALVRARSEPSIQRVRSQFPLVQFATAEHGPWA